MKKKIIAPIAVIVSMTALSVGTTVAIFTSRASSAINLTAGKVDVTMDIDNFATYSGEWNETTEEYDIVPTAVLGTFTNGGTASITEGILELDRISPMDKVEFDLTFTNNSNINVKYRTCKQLLSDTGLFEGLDVEINDEKYDGMTDFSSWTILTEEGEIVTYHISVILPEEAGNEYQEKECSLKFSIDMVQSNAHVTDMPEGVDLCLYTAYDLKVFGDKLNAGNTYFGKTIMLMNDVDMGDYDWSVLPTMDSYPSNSFRGTFDGDNHIISNLNSKSDLPPYACAGLFGAIESGTVKNVVLDYAVVSSTHYAGGICGYISGGTSSFINCAVSNSIVTSTPELIGDEYDNGDKVGGIAGYVNGNIVIDGCKVVDTTISAYRDLGGILGYGKAEIKNCLVKDTTIIQDNENGYKSSPITTYGKIVGNDDGCTLTDNQTENVSLNKISFVTPETISEQLATVNDGDTVFLSESTSNYTLPTSISGKEVFLVGDGEAEDTVVNRNTAQGLPSSILNLSNVTLEGAPKGSSYIGFQHTSEETYVDCIFTGITFFYASEMTFSNCTFVQEEYEYCFWTYGAENVTFNNCTFETKGKAAKVYNESTDGTFNITFNGCTFKSSETTHDKPAVAINSLGATFNVTLNNCTATNFNCNDDAMTTWYATRMAGAPTAVKCLAGAEGQLDKINVKIDGTTY